MTRTLATRSHSRTRAARSSRPCALGFAALALVLLSLAPATARQGAATAQPKDEPALESGKTVEREIKGGEAHAYSFTLRRGQFLRAVVAQRGVDVVATLYGPGGEKLLETDIFGYLGPEPISFEATQAGAYRLEVHTFEPGAARGRYELTSEAKERAAAADVERAAAERLLIEAGALEQEGSKESQQRALEKRQESLATWRRLGDKFWEAYALHYNGSVLKALGENQKALSLYEQALTLRRAIGDRAGEATTLNSIGGVYSNLGEKQKALEFFNLSLSLARAVGDRSGEAITLNNIGGVYDDLGEREEALEFYNLSLPLTRALGDRWGEATTLTNIGLVYDSLGQRLKALGFYDLALPIRRAVGDQSGEAATLNNIGLAYNYLGERQKALEFFNLSLPLMRAVGDRAGEAVTLVNLMFLWSDLGKPALAIFHGKQAVNLYQQLRGNIQGLDKGTQKTYLQTVELRYRQLADLLISQGRLPEAEQVLALLKEEEHSGLLSRRDQPASDIGYSPAEAGVVKVLAQLADLGRERGELAALNEKKALDGPGKTRLDQIERELLPKANAEYSRALDTVSREAPDTATKTAEVKDAQALMGHLRKMGPGTVALYTIISNEKGRAAKGWVMLVAPDLRKAYEMDVSGLEETVLALRDALRSPDADEPRPRAQKLYRAIFQTPQPKGGPTLEQDLETYLKNQKERTLMWSLDGVLRYVPMAVLSPDGEHYLVERFRNVVFTPASLPGLTQPVSRDWRALGLGVSKKYAPFKALDGVPRELAAIVREEGKAGAGVLPGVAHLDEEFDAGAMLDGLREGFPVVHIATHFRYDSADPNKSFLLLGDGAHLEMTTFNDASQIFEKTELLTLSACDTAMGSSRDANGRDAEGLGYVAQKLGAQAVIATLWPLDDASAQVLMPEFYRLRQANAGMPKAEALRRAQLALLTGTIKPAEPDEGSRFKGVGADAKAPYAHPYFWAPFILIGNWK